MRLAERSRDRAGGNHPRPGGERDPEPHSEATAAPARGRCEDDKEDRERDDRGQGNAQQARTEADQHDDADEDDPCRSDRHDGSCDARHAGGFPVQSEPHASTDPGGRHSVDERAYPVTRNRSSPGHRLAARCQARAPGAAAACERGGECHS
jgi:hypothetical protein